MSGPGHAPADQLERDRLTAELDRTLFVEAGAGSGKTSALVARVVELLLSGALGDVSELAAITFTEAAAAELRDRIREALERRIDDLAAGTVERARVDAALAHIDEAAISTLHGFAYRLLASYPVEAGLPPGFEVADEIESHVESRERWDGFLDVLFADPAREPILRRAFTLGLKVSQLRAVAIEFTENWDRLVDIDLADHPPAPIEVGPLLDALDTAIERARSCTSTASYPSDVIDDLEPFRAVLAAETDPDDRLLLLVHDAPRYLLRGVSKDDLVALRRQVEAAKQVHADLLAALRIDALEPILADIRRFTLDSVRARREQGRVRYHDLLVLARSLLVEHAHVRRALAGRHRLLLIDEFQDTDPLQTDIALLLTLRDPDHVPDRWEDAEVDEGRLFFVGDPKQSIYRFRRADIEVFERVRDSFGHHGIVELSVNFRTVPSLLQWVNAVFDTLIGPVARNGQPRYLPLAPARDDIGDEAPVVVLGGPVDVDRVAELRERESREVAAVVAQMKAEGWPVHLPGEPAPRGVQFRDVTILIPSRQVLAELERALDREGVPYRVESRSLVFGTDEVRELLAILQAIDDPGDEVALIAALRSPAFACSDPALARYRAAGGWWNYLRVDASAAALPDDDPVVAAMRALRGLHHERSWLPVNELVERVIRERRMVELTMARRRPRDHWRRYRMVLDEARRFVEAGGLALADFIAYIEQQGDERAMRVETVVSERDDDAVRILTVHGAKGLEFPVVVLAGLGIAYRAPYNRVFWTPGGPEIALGSKNEERFETPGYEAIQQREEELDRYERDRLLYVAATRARDHLVVSLYHATRSDCAAARLHERMAALADLHREISPVATRAAAAAGRPGAGGEAAVAFADASTEALEAREGIDELARWRDERAALLRAASRPAAIAPTALARAALARAALAARADEAAAVGEPAAAGEVAEDDAGRRDEAAERRGGDGADSTAERFGRRGHAGTAIGRAVHGVLQVVDLADPRDLADLAAAQAQVEGVADRARTVERLARSAIESPSVREAVTTGRYWREVFVAAPVGRAPAGAKPVLVEGYIDLLYEDAAGDLVVVDYKTDQARDDAELDASFARYRLQGAAYAAAVGAALGRSVARCVFVFARTSGAVERSIDDVAAAVVEVEQAVGAL